ncbi:unnamed protein product, partial [Allacma fusca]
MVMKLEGDWPSEAKMASSTAPPFSIRALLMQETARALPLSPDVEDTEVLDKSHHHTSGKLCASSPLAMTKATLADRISALCDTTTSSDENENDEDLNA